MRPTSLILSVVVPFATACSDDVVSYSEPVGISLGVASGDVDNGTLLDEKNINTESGNPYGAFSAAAQDAVGGLPSRIEVDEVTLEIVSSNNVDALEAIYAGDVDVSFVPNSSDAVYPVAVHGIGDGDGLGPVDFHVHFDSDAVGDADYADLVAGSFKVVLSGAAAAGFADLNADANLSLVLTFTAFE